MKKLLLTVWLTAILVGMAVQASAATSTTLQSAVAADGNGTAATVFDYGEIALQVTITGKASVNLEGSADSGTTYSAIACRRGGSTAGDVSTTSSSGLFFCNATGITNIRTPVVGWQTGTVTSVASVPGDSAGGAGVSLETLLSGEDQTNNLLMTSGGAVRGTATNLMSAVSTNTTGSVVTAYTGSKTVSGILTCNAGGSTNCGITITIYGSPINTQATGTKIQLCQIVIPTGAAVTSDACAPITAAFPYIWAETTGVAGTSPSLNVALNY